ncbi:MULTISPECIES: lipopolysaccharide biosynthesis protein [unclassified Streptomyces]|uniref:lipopolysaccharide biosynthesis protein n=1 Tax=unclassified Streptomyces TaxID=2593676 RepID=UPI0024420E05|nr:lipopolysaccharide biosynthesis protein [Streptomyces sp. DH41]MDG9721496.1 lipopolysaccharide biosynthesis protein [Streptomyces sp. DH41]
MTESLTRPPAADPAAANPADRPTRPGRVRAALHRVRPRNRTRPRTGNRTGNRTGPRTLPPWAAVAATALAGGLLGAGYGLATTPRYTATSYVVAVPTDKSDPASALGFAQAYGRVATQLAVLGDAQMWAGVPVTTLEKSVRTATSPDAPMVSVSATSSRPEEAADMANAVSRALTRHAETSADDTHVELRQFARATEPTEASSASSTVTGLVGASAGGLLGGLALLVRPRRSAREPGRAAAGPAAVPGPASAADVRGQL